MLDEKGHCVGMIVCGCEFIEGVVDPTNAYFIPYKYLKEVAEEVPGFEPLEYESIIEIIRRNKLETILGVLTVVPVILSIILYAIKKYLRVYLFSWGNVPGNDSKGLLRFLIDDLDMYLFSWDNVPGNESERLLRFLMDNLYIAWAKNAKILKLDDGKAINISRDNHSAEITINEKKEKAILKISDGRTYYLKVKKKNDKLNIYLGMGWVENAEISKPDNGKIIYISEDNHSAEIMIDEKKKKAALNISDGRTYYLKVKKENGKLKIYRKVGLDRYVTKKIRGFFMRSKK